MAPFVGASWNVAVVEVAVIPTFKGWCCGENPACLAGELDRCLLPWGDSSAFIEPSFTQHRMPTIYTEENLVCLSWNFN